MSRCYCCQAHGLCPITCTWKQIAASSSRKISTVQRIDVSGIQTLDTAGTQILHTLLGHERALQLAQDTAVLTAPQRALLLAVVQAQQSADQTLHAPAAASGNVVTDMLERRPTPNE